MNEVDKFFGDLPKQDEKVAEIFEEKKDEPKVVEEEKKNDDEEGRKNRRHRRLEEQLQRERESNIALNERIKALAEAREYASQNDNSTDSRLVRIFGATDEGKEIAKHFSEILAETKDEAREQALREFELQQVQEREEQQKYEQQIDSELESLEDQYNIDLTSDAPKARKTRREFLELVQNLSPKDEDGTITGYADFNSTFELYQQTHQEKVDNSRQKEIASRTMQKSGASNSEGTQNITPGFRGWQKDYNI